MAELALVLGVTPDVAREVTYRDLAALRRVLSRDTVPKRTPKPTAPTTRIVHHRPQRPRRRR